MNAHTATPDRPDSALALIDELIKRERDKQ